MEGKYLKDDFKEFIKPDADRKAFIQNYLNGIGLDCPVIQIDGKNHLYVSFPKNQYNSIFRVKTIIAHYDRVKDSPGANDNSSSVYAFLGFAKRLTERQGCHNIRMIFSDGEENGENGVASQGAFGLAKLFKRLGITKDDVYAFDCMGRGNIPILTESVIPKKAPGNFVKDFLELENRAEKIIKSASNNRWLKLPCNYSDNAGFIANGIPAVAFTMLPSEEADAFLRFGKKPDTWRRLHTMEDNFESLDENAFEITGRILDSLADLRTLCR